MRPRAAKSSFAILAACVWLGVGMASAANPAYLGPLNVRLVEKGADGKTTPIKHAPVYLNARNADTDANGTATFDGVPAGRHTLKARLPGYAALERSIDLATGARQPVELTLLKTPGVDWRGTLRDAASSAPIAGAAIGILPIEVPSSLQGPGHAVTDWEGAFEFVDLPPGRYALTATAPGFEVLKGEYRVKPAEEGSRVFDNPTLDGVALDLCLTEGGQCGKPAADAYCQRQGLGASLEHRVKNDSPPTRIIASGKVCDGKHCDRIEWLRCGGLGEADNLRLKPTATPTRLGLKVTDARSQQPLVGARVTLAETWPSGEIASAVTGPGGQIVFANLKNGPANWPDAENKVSLARRRVTARIEADGYAPRVFPANLGEDLTVALNPTTAQAEAEPNDLSAPQDVLTGAPMQFSIESNKDHDTFRFRISEPARVIVTVGPSNPLETYVRLRDSNANLLHESGAYRGNDNRVELRLAEGTYYAEISEWGEDASAPGKLLTLNIDATPATDPNEPNGTTQQATPARLAEHLSGIVWPLGDRDVYRIEVTRPGILRIREPGMPMERHVRLLDRDGKQLADQGTYTGNAIDFNHQVLPGTHYVELMEWGNDNASLTPYRMRVDFLPDDGIDDPAAATGSIRAVRVLEPGGSVHSTLLPRGDVDLYNIAIPGAGVLRLSSQGRPERHLQLFDRNGKLLTEQGVYANNPSDVSWSLAGADTLILGIREWGNDSYAASAYALKAWFEPADEIDVMQRNDDFEHATPLAVGDIVHGSYKPRGDLDVYVLEADVPGYLRVKASSALETHVRIYDAQRKLIVEQGVYAGQPTEQAPAIAAGTYYVMIGEWGNDNAASVPYELSVALERVEPGETWPLAGDPQRRLKDGEAQAFAWDQRGDLDRFMFELGRPGKVDIHVVSPLETLLRVYDDQTGKLLHESGHYAPAQVRIPLEFKTPARLRIELQEWGNDAARLQQGFVMVDTQGRALSAANIAAQAVKDDPLRVAFRKEAPIRGETAARCDLDVNRDGRADLSLSGDQAREYRFAEAGLYAIESVCQGAAGQTSRQRFWVQTSLPRERKGVALFLSSPAQGQVLDEAIDLRAHAMSYDGNRIARVELRIDGALSGSDYSPPYEFSPAWQTLSPGKHDLLVTAYDVAGIQAEIQREFTLSEYFGLTPADGAVLSGDKARVAWTGLSFGAAQVRYRKKGSDAWRVAVGESGRARSVALTDLEAGVAYEFQPLGATEGPVRSLTRVKGLAFGEARYGANIRRDYDQKVGISVRNNGDKPLKVRLECAKPSDPLLLVGFVGEGSEDKPIDLGPGEARQFVLGISAQDVTRADHVFAVRMVSDTGLSDEVEVAVHVQLPRVELVWEDKGAAPDGQGRLYRLVNKADAITDLEVSAADPDKVSIVPTVRHGLLQAGQSRDFTVTPQYYEGYTGVDTTLVARALDKRIEQPYATALAPGESARRIWLFPGQNLAAVDVQAERQAIANAERAETLKPESVDWKRRDNPEDTDNDGRIDRWSQQIGDVRWVGDDSDNNGEVDFVHADIGDDGVFEYSALQEKGRWRPTNLVEAWLEMGFALPWSRGSYKEHDADIVLNGVVIGELKNTIPEGNYAFRIPPNALKFDDSGKPGDNQVGIRSKHLRGGHYVVNSDFRFKFRLTATPVWTVAKSPEEARANAAKMSGVSVSAADFSVSSADMRLVGPANPKAGDDMSIEVGARNLGSAAHAGVPVALVRALPSGTKEEIARIIVPSIGLNGVTQLRIPFKARGGANTLIVTLDPDQAFEDLDRANNSGSLFLQVAGDAKPPELQVNSPVDAQSVADGLVAINASATDDQGLSGLHLSIDGGLWQDLQAENGAARRALLLQPGEHRLVIRAVDFSDNVAERKLVVRSTATAPQLRVIAPASGARIDARVTRISTEVADDTTLVAARAAGGPWYRATPEAGRATVDLPLNFGGQTIEIMAADKHGIVASSTLRIDCTRQPSAADDAPAPASENGVVWPATRPDMEIDLFKGSSGLLAPVDPEARARLQRAQDDEQRQERDLEASLARATEARRAQEAEIETTRQQTEAARVAEEERERTARAAQDQQLRDEQARQERAAEAQWLRDEQARLANVEVQRRIQEESARRAQEAEAEARWVLQEDDKRAQAEAATRRARDEQEQLARQEEIQRLNDDATRRALEEELRRAREEAERLRLELERERMRNLQGGRDITATTPAPAVVVAPWPGTQGTVALPTQPVTPTQPAMLLFEIDSRGKLKNRPEKASKFELEQAHVITQIRTRHWNGGIGAAPGSIGLRCRDGKIHGPWQAVGMPDAKGVANADWVVYPNIVLDASVCSIVDSDPNTWSHNDDTKNRGLVRVEGYPSSGAKAVAPRDPGTGKGGYIDKADSALDKVDSTLNKLNKLLDIIKK